jgi:hypothetical protein
MYEHVRQQLAPILALPYERGEMSHFLHVSGKRKVAAYYWCINPDGKVKLLQTTLTRETLAQDLDLVEQNPAFLFWGVSQRGLAFCQLLQMTPPELGNVVRPPAISLN